MKKLFLLLATSLLISSLAVNAWSATVPYSYEVIDLNAPFGTDSDNTAVDINNGGQIIGKKGNTTYIYSTATGSIQYLSDTTANPHSINNNGQVVGDASGTAFLYSGGTMTSLGVDTRVAYSINDSGIIAGYGNFLVNPLNPPSSQNADRGFIYNNGVLTQLGVLPPSSNTDTTAKSYAYSINNAGQVAGKATYPNASNKIAFLDTGGVINMLGTTGGLNNTANSINNNGQVVGLDASNHVFLYDNGMSDLSTIIFNGCHAALANDINNLGQVVGIASGGSGTTSFLYDGSMTDLSSSSVINTTSYINITANAINDLGQIAATGKWTGSQFHTRPLLLTPFLIWDGGGTTNNWTTQINWNYDTAPVKGIAIIFTGVNRQTNVNNSSLTNVGLVTFANGGFNISGNQLILNAGIVSTGDNTWAINSTLGYSQSFTSLSGTLTVSGNVNNNGKLLTVDGPGSHLISGAISGTGGLTKSGPGDLTLSSTNNTYQDDTTVNAGVLEITGGVKLGATTLIDVEGGQAVLKTTNVNNSSLNIETDLAGAFVIADGTHTIGTIEGSGTTEVNGQLTVNSIEQGTLTIGPGGILTIAALPGGPTSETAQITAVPEPATLILMITGVFCVLIYRRMRIVSVRH